MGQAYKCDICGDFYEGHERLSLAPLVSWRAGSTHVYLDTELRLTSGGHEADVCARCFEATLRAAAALFDGKGE